MDRALDNILGPKAAVGKLGMKMKVGVHGFRQYTEAAPPCPSTRRTRVWHLACFGCPERSRLFIAVFGLFMVYNGAVARRASVFELNDTILERIIFAMEDQGRSHYIDLRTGELTPKPEKNPQDRGFSGESVPDGSLADALLPEWIAPPPRWTPADGFRLMESFCARISRMETKLALNRAISRGKGVFKAFRQTLSEYPDEEAFFRDYKNAMLRRHVELWMDDMREALGLARLGAEPEELQDLADEEFCLETSSLAEAPFSLEDFIARALEESRAWLPDSAAALEKAELGDFLSRHMKDGILHYVNETEGRPIAAAAMAFIPIEGGAAGLIRFLHVVPEFRGLGLELKLVDSLRSRCRGAGPRSCFLRSALVSPSLSAILEGGGIKTCGVHYLIE